MLVGTFTSLMLWNKAMSVCRTCLKWVCTALSTLVHTYKWRYFNVVFLTLRENGSNKAKSIHSFQCKIYINTVKWWWHVWRSTCMTCVAILGFYEQYDTKFELLHSCYWWSSHILYWYKVIHLWWKPSTGLSKKMDGIWYRYNLKSTGRIYTFGVLKFSEEFKLLDLP